MEFNLSREVLHLLDRLEFTPKIKTSQHLSGRHFSPLVGSTPDFLEYRMHGENEPVSIIDWRASAKRDRALVKKNEHQGLVQHWLAVDSSASMMFPAPDSLKYQTQILLSGVLIHLFSGQGDSIGMLFERDQGHVECYSPRRTREGLSEMIRSISEHQITAGEISLVNGLQTLERNLYKPSVIWAISDFADEPEGIVELLSQFASRGHDVRAIHLYHPDERDLPWRGECEFKDLEERHSDVLIYPERLREEYAKVYDEHLQFLKDSFDEGGVAYYYLDVTEPLQEHLLKIFRAA